MHTKLNGAHLSDYGAALIEYTVGPCSNLNNYLTPSGRMYPVKLKSKVGLRRISLTLEFYSYENIYFYDGKKSWRKKAISARLRRTIITENISNLTAQLRNEAELELPDTYLYTCELDNVSTPKEIAPWIMQVRFDFVGYRHFALHTKQLSSSGSINVCGNYETMPIVKLTPAQGTTTMRFNEITIINASGQVTINGMNTTIKDEDGNNKFADTDITAWPILQPGINNITIQGVSQAEISYYPIYL